MDKIRPKGRLIKSQQDLITLVGVKRESFTEEFGESTADLCEVER